MTIDNEYWYESENANWNHRRRASEWHFDPTTKSYEDFDKGYIKHNFMQFECDWQDELENTEFLYISESKKFIDVNELLVRGVIQECLELGRNYITYVSKQAYTTPETHPKIWKMVESTGIKDFAATIIAQQPVESFHTHMDTICNCSLPGDSRLVQSHDELELDHDTHRFFIALEDWKWGHFFQVGNFNWHQWKAGDTLWYDWRHMPHSTANAGQKQRYMLKVTGKWPEKNYLQ